MSSERILAVVQTSSGVLELNYSWLPTWMGMNASLKKEIEDALGKELVGKPLDEFGLLGAHALVVNFLVQRFPQITGLRDFLDGLRYLSIQ